MEFATKCYANARSNHVSLFFPKVIVLICCFSRTSGITAFFSVTEKRRKNCIWIDNFYFMFVFPWKRKKTKPLKRHVISTRRKKTILTQCFFVAVVFFR